MKMYKNEETPSVLDYGFDTYEMVNPNYAKLTFKLNGSGNLTIEATPSFTPGVKPEGIEHGKVPKGTKVFDYDKKIIISMSFADCYNIVKMSNNPNGDSALKLYRNSTKYNKLFTIQCIEDATKKGESRFYYTLYFDSTDVNGTTIKFKLPMSFDAFDEFAMVLQSYLNCYHMIKYYNQIEKAKIKSKKDNSEENEEEESTKTSSNYYC